MSTRIEQLKAEALSLPRDEREEIVQALLNSLDDDPGVDPEWYAEVLRRLEEIRSGKAEMISGEEFTAELEEFLSAKVSPAPESTS